jgi:hippurate hydrolase
LTVRTYKKEVRQRVLSAIQRTARGLAVAAGVPEDRMPIVSISETERGDALYNDPALTARMVKVWAAAFPKDRIVEIPPSMVSEDVGHFGLDGQIPVLQFRVGAVAPGTLAKYKASGQPLPALHSAEFAPLPEPAIRSGIKATVLAVFELLSK